MERRGELAISVYVERTKVDQCLGILTDTGGDHLDHQRGAFPPSLKCTESQPAALAPPEDGFLQLIGCQAQSARCPPEHVSMTNLSGRVRAFPHSLPLRQNNSCVDVGRFNTNPFKGRGKPRVIGAAQSYWFVGFYDICSSLLGSDILDLKAAA